MPKTSKMMSQLLLYAIIVLTVSASTVSAFPEDECVPEFENVEGCKCMDFREGHDLWCPSAEDPRVRFQLEPPKLQIVCTPDLGDGFFDYEETIKVDEPHLLHLMTNVSIGGVVSIFLMRHCPIPSDSFSVYTKTMNITRPRDLRINYGVKSGEVGRLQADVFSGLPDLRILQISGSENLIEFDVNAFRGLPNVQQLRITQNLLTFLPTDIFLPLDNLIALEILEAQMQELQPGLMRSLTKLNHLKIDATGLTAFHPDVFPSQTELQTVFLFHIKNGSMLLDREAHGGKSLFHHAPFLKNVTINGRGLHHVDWEVFANNTKLDRFTWHSNRCDSPQDQSCIVQPSSFVRGKEYLRYFHVIRSEGAKFVLNDDFFRGCYSLVDVTITNANLETLPLNLFQDSNNLMTLDLSGNRIRQIPDEFLHQMHNLRRLSLRSNRLEEINNKHFRVSSELKTLDLSWNDIRSLHKSSFSFTSKLEHLDLRRNQIYFNDSSQPKWSAMTNMAYLDLSHNNITLRHLSRTFSTLLLQLKMLNFSHNNIGPALQIADLNWKQNKIMVDLTHNAIEYVDYPHWMGSAYLRERARHLPKNLVNLTDNPLVCDCRNVDLVQQIQGDLEREVSAVDSWFSFMSGITCVDDANNKTVELEKIDPDKMFCPFPADYMPSGLECPDNCTCAFFPSIDNVVVNCTGTDLAVPSFLPDLEDRSTNVTLDLSNNGIVGLSDFTSGNNSVIYENVTGLDLSNNSLSRIDLNHLPKKLTSLSLKNNNIRRFYKGQVERLFNSSITKLWLGGNPYDCDCDSRVLYRLVKRDRNNIVQDFEDVYLACRRGREYVKHIVDRDHFCHDAGDYALYVGTPFGALLLLILIFGSVCLCYKEKVQVFIYSRPYLRAMFCRPDDNDEKEYDCFVSYSHEDSIFVENQLVPMIEEYQESPGDPTYRCLVHVRDFIPGESIPDQIVKAVSNSSRTLIFLTKHFVQSDWARREFQSAQQADCPVIVVLNGPMPTREEMGENLYEYLQTTTYLEWEDPWFFQKLIYALPHKVSQARCFGGVFRMSRKKRRTNDQHQLINRHGSTASSNGGLAYTVNGVSGNNVNYETNGTSSSPNGLGLPSRTTPTSNGRARTTSATSGTDSFFSLGINSRPNSISPSNNVNKDANINKEDENGISVVNT